MPRHSSILGKLALLVFLCYGCGGGCGNDWQEQYRYNRKSPYDLYALYNLLEARAPGLVFHEDTLSALLADSTTDANYVYIGQTIYLDETDITGLLNFVELGNTAFIATKWMPEDLAYHFFGPNCQYYFEYGLYNGVSSYIDDTIHPQLTQEDLLPNGVPALSFVNNHKPVNHEWYFLDDFTICDEEYGLEVLGNLDSGHNFLRLPYGDGELYFHTTPELFTNYFLSDSSRYDYARGVFSYLAPGPVYWDEYSRSWRPPPRTNNRNQWSGNGGRNLLSDNHALSFILQQPALAFAWYLLLFSGLLYIIFRGKRRQRIIPVRTPKENSSLQFVDTIARLTEQHGNHSRLAKEEIKVLRHYLSDRFKIRWPEGQDPPLDLAERTGLAPTIIEEALIQIKFVNQRNYMEPGDLLRFYRAIQPIYKV